VGAFSVRRWLIPPKGEDSSNGRVFVQALLLAGGGIAAASLLFAGASSLVSVFLTAFAQVGTVDALLERNRREIWEEEVPSLVANRRLAVSLLLLFAGTLLAYSLAVSMLPRDRVAILFDRQLEGFVAGGIADVRFGPILRILGHNSLTLLVCFLLAVLYRSGGMLLVLCWNGSVWGALFAWLARFGEAPGLGRVAHGVVGAATILPHLVMEGLAYVLAAMGGVFLSKALIKYELDSSAFDQVRRAVLRITVLGAVLVCAAAAVETWLAPRVLQLLLP
jgi:uncharacterized membrane protein SpoIIM required for sporulation